MKKKVLLTVLCMVLVSAVSILGTLAYLTDSERVENTFTVGAVDIVLDEADVDEDGQPIPGADRVKGNKYHLIPGKTYTKDPTMTVGEDSEESYLRLMVEINCLSELDAIFAPQGADLLSIFTGYDPNTWLYEGETRNTTDNTITYEFRYKEAVNGKDANGGPEAKTLDALFDSFTLPTFINGDQLKTLETLKITVTGHAIQTATFDTEDAAWAAFDQQMNPAP